MLILEMRKSLAVTLSLKQKMEFELLDSKGCIPTNTYCQTEGMQFYRNLMSCRRLDD